MKIKAIKTSTLNVIAPPPRNKYYTPTASGNAPKSRGGSTFRTRSCSSGPSLARPTLWREDPQVVNGALIVPNRPGHGMEFSELAMREYLVG